MDLDTELTDAQQQALRENAVELGKVRARFREVQKDARSHLESVGLVDNGIDAGQNCLVCMNCQQFEVGDDGDCGKCGHDLFSHNVK
ncbi:hypothetical protein [Streptomyces sp. NPDC054887]